MIAAKMAPAAVMMAANNERSGFFGVGMTVLSPKEIRHPCGLLA
jgi:hypothetical protein